MMMAAWLCQRRAYMHMHFPSRPAVHEPRTLEMDLPWFGRMTLLGETMSSALYAQYGVPNLWPASRRL